MTTSPIYAQSLAALVRAAASRSNCPKHGRIRGINVQQCAECAFEAIEARNNKAHTHITRALQILRRTETRGE